MSLLPCQRHLFDIPRDVAYLNCAFMSPLLSAAQRAGEEGLARKARPWLVTTTDFFTETEATRELFARLIGAAADDIAFIPAVSYGMAAAARNLPLRRGQAVVMPAEEFPSGVYAWRQAAHEAGADIVTVPRPEDGDWTAALCAAIDARTAVVLASETHWVCGGRMDLAAISARAKAVGAALVLDLTQSGGAVPFNVKAIDPDFVAAASYKWLMGPYTLGYLYVAPRHQAGRPLEQGWICREGAEDFRRLADCREDFQPGARRFDMGQRSNFALMPVAKAALEQLLAWGPANTAETLAALTARIAGAAAELGAESQPAHLRSPHYLGLRFARGLPDNFAAGLAARNVHVSLRGDRVRITPHLYNDEEDVARLLEALKASLHA
ncbi:aminotransferase class V-fold PLP-dependent enzyme [Pedomonas mirosovicensis]|uniref:aminotransferase class V-fold PLP-dependent enzyme n=1 Tax=Pedomonas mirosovicensis TaxID=2908641 RepID=UPI00216997F6|nr:aminotransferase class V-fold PLP-dependent enzyme [Pedomonas mirosovicensis]MCH8685317.1 aminotransferase class V-fold PLP-dependent enzyme [Pedomonas mirosovicensis]